MSSNGRRWLRRAEDTRPAQDTTNANHSRPTWRERNGQLFRKYLMICASLVSATLLLSGVVQVYSAIRDNQSAAIRLQREKAVAAADSIEQFIGEIELLLNWVSGPRSSAGESELRERREEYQRVRALSDAITEVRYIEPSGTESVRDSRIDLSPPGANFSADPRFTEPRPGKPYFSPVYFRDNSEPYMSIAVADAAPPGGVTVAEVNLKLAVRVVSRIKVGRTGYAYAVSPEGFLITHPDLSLVLRKLDLSARPEVERARAAEARGGGGADEGIFGPNIEGRRVLTAFKTLESLRWMVFVDQPLEEAFEPLLASIGWTVALLLLGLGLSVVASYFLARRMVTPIRQLQEGAARLGAGALDSPIDVHTGDELEALAEEFNRMAAQLRESYAGLEQRVEERTQELAERTRELADANSRLEVASQNKSDFLRNMAHEAGNALQTIIGMPDALLQRIYGGLNEKQEEYLEHILTSGRHLQALTKDVLDLAKIEAGQMQLELTEFSLPDVLNQAFTMVREGASRYGVRLMLSVGPGIGTIEGDETRVKQVLLNLLLNAVKFTADGGQVVVTATMTASEVQIAVRDTGVGLAIEDQERVFGEFYQAAPAASDRARGTGLGLPLARRLVELHGGRIWLDSRLGEGSTFTFALPLGVRAPLPDVAEPTRPAGVS